MSEGGGGGGQASGSDTCAPQDPTPPHSDSGRYEMKTTQNKCKLFVRNIDFKVNHRELSAFFEKFGKVIGCEILRERKHPHRNQGVGFVTFEEAKTAERALGAAAHDLNFRMRTLQLEPEKRKKLIGERATNAQEQNVEKEEEEEEGEEEEGEEGLHLHDLPEEILLKIFSVLPLRCVLQNSRVCSRWRVLASRVWHLKHHISFQDLCTRFGGVDDVLLVSLLKQCGPNLRSLNFVGCSHMLSDISLVAIGMHCPRITHFCLSNASCTDKGLEKFAKACRHLENVSLKMCHAVGEDGLWWLFNKSAHLKNISLEGNRRLTGKCFHVLRGGAESLMLANCTQLNDSGLELIALRCQKMLKNINLSCCYSTSDDGITALIQHCKLLEVIHLDDISTQVSSGCLRNLGSLHCLREVYLKENDQVDDQVVKAISEGCPQLRVLDLQCCHRSVTDLSMESLSWLQHLEELKISYLHLVHDAGLGMLASMQSLQKLTARGCGGITNEGVRAITRDCSQLQYLDISGCLQLNESILTKEILEKRSKLNHTLTLVIGGTGFQVGVFDPLPSYICFDVMDLSRHNLIPDHQIDSLEFLSSDSEDEFEVVGDYDDFLDGDDPLLAEEFEMS